MIFAGIAGAGSRAVGLAVSAALFLLTRPGGWAVLVVLALLWLQWSPGP